VACRSSRWRQGEPKSANPRKEAIENDLTSITRLPEGTWASIADHRLEDGLAGADRVGVEWVAFGGAVWFVCLVTAAMRLFGMPRLRVPGSWTSSPGRRVLLPVEAGAAPILRQDLDLDSGRAP